MSPTSAAQTHEPVVVDLRPMIPPIEQPKVWKFC